MMTLKRVVRGLTSTSSDAKYKRRRKEEEVEVKKKDKEIAGVKQTLNVTLDLCERNGKSENGSQLWFNVLDRLINAKSFLRLSKEMPDHAAIVETVLSDLLQLTMQRMVSNVPLMDLVRKITTDHAGSRLGEFREMIGSMLETYGFEVDVCESAAEVMHTDVRDMMDTRRELKLRGGHVNSLLSFPFGSSVINELVKSKPLHTTATFLTVTSDGHADFMTTKNTTKENTSPFDQAVSVLKKRRLAQTRGVNTEKLSKGAMMMTLKDREFLSGEEIGGGSTRMIGALSCAEHFGRF